MAGIHWLLERSKEKEAPGRRGGKGTRGRQGGRRAEGREVEEEEEKEKEDNREKAKEVEHQCGKFPKELVLWMRKSEDVTSDEYASFYSSLSHDWKENLSVKHFSVLGRLVARFVVRAKPRAFPSCVRATRK